MSDKTIPPTRGGAIYRVTCLRANVDARTATELDFFEVEVFAPNRLTACLKARNEHADCANAFDAKLVGAAQYVALIGDQRIATTAALVEHY